MPDLCRRQLAGQLIRCAQAPTELLTRVAPEWIHVFPSVLFNHPVLGNVDPSMPLLDLLVHNNNRYSGDLVVDYNHASIEDEDAPAAGFVDFMERRDDGIWGRISQWTDKARAGIESGEWRYISPTWFIAAWSRHDGAWIGPAWHSIALTNTPQIDGMNDVPDWALAGASRSGRHLSLPPHVFLDDPATATREGASLLFVPPFAAPVVAATPDPEPPPGDPMKSFPLLLVALSLSADFDLEAEDADEQLAAAANALKPSEEGDAAVPAELLSALDVDGESEAPLSACLGKVALLKASAVDPQEQGRLLQENLELRASARVRDANLAPAAVPHAMNLAKAVRAEGDDADKAFAAFLATAPRIPSSVPTPSVKDDPGVDGKSPVAATLTPEQKKVAKQLGVSEEKYAAELSKAATA